MSVGGFRRNPLPGVGDAGPHSSGGGRFHRAEHVENVLHVCGAIVVIGLSRKRISQFRGADSRRGASCRVDDGGWSCGSERGHKKPLDVAACHSDDQPEHAGLDYSARGIGRCMCGTVSSTVTECGRHLARTHWPLNGNLKRMRSFSVHRLCLRFRLEYQRE